MAEPRTRTDLSDLVRERRADLRLSLRVLAAACIDPTDPGGGPRWTHGVLAKLENGKKIIPPEEPELRALAAGLQLSARPVQEAAAAQFMGVDVTWSDDGDARALVRDYHSMGPADQARVREIIDAWKGRRPSGESDEQ